jgi:hypothetical protein
MRSNAMVGSPTTVPLGQMPEATSQPIAQLELSEQRLQDD